MLSELTQEELSAGLDRIAADILAETHVERPPVDAFAVAERLGIAVAMDDRQSGRARYVRLARGRSAQPKAAILLRPEPRCERRHWAIAHEIGEHAACRVFRDLQVDPRETAANAREQVANQMASHLLLPTAWFVPDGAACGWDLLALKHRYATASHELIVRRMLECRPRVIISVFDAQRLSWRRSNLGGRVPPPSARGLAWWRKVHDGARPARPHGGGQTVQGWPVHEDGWVREILRTELDDVVDEVS